MAWIGQGIAFAALVAAAAYLEINGKDASGLWVIVVLCAIFAEWHPKQSDKSDT